jgi:hypothetical protein
MHVFTHGRFEAIGERLRQDWQDLIDSPLPDRLRRLLALLAASEHGSELKNDRVFGELLAIDEPSTETAILLEGFRHALKRAANRNRNARKNKQ